MMKNPLTLRGPMALAGAVLAGGLSAGCLAFSMSQGGTLLMLIVYLTAIPLFIAGLGGGSMAGLVAGLTGCAALSLVLPSNYMFVYAFLFAIPAIALSMLALRFRIGTDGKTYWYPEGYLLTAATLYPCAILLVIGFLTLNVEGGFQGLTARLMHDAFVETLTQVRPDALPQADAIFNNFIKILPAVVGCTFVLSTAISMGIAQAALVQQKWNLRTAFSFQGMHVPRAMIIGLVLASLIGSFAATPYDYIGTNIGVMLCIPFFFSGLSVVHGLAPLTGWPTVTLVIFYILLLGLIWLSLPVMLLGVSDQWIHFRQRFAARLNTANTSI